MRNVAKSDEPAMDKQDSKLRTWMANSAIIDRIGLIVSLAILVVLFATISPYFFNINNFSNMLMSISLIGIVSTGMTLVIIGGGFDLSVGSNMALTGVIVGSMLHSGYSQWAAIPVGLAIGVALGLVNGFSIAKLKINPFITTLSTMIIVRGAAFIYSNGTSFGIYGTKPAFPDFGFWGRGNVASIPVPIILMCIVAIVGQVVLRRSVFGREIYAVGGNEEAATISGINKDRILMSIYVISGVLASFAGIILSSRLTAGVPSAGNGYEMNAVAAVVLGGASLKGGAGKISDTLLAVLVLGVLGNGFVLLGLSSFWQDVARGLILMLSVGLDQFRSKRSLS